MGYEDRKIQSIMASHRVEKLDKQVLDRHWLDVSKCNIKRNCLFFTDFSVLPGGCGNQNQQYKLNLWIGKLCKNWLWIEDCIESHVYYKKKPTEDCVEMA